MIWVDPLDGTAEFTKGKIKLSKTNTLRIIAFVLFSYLQFVIAFFSGLIGHVTILIGIAVNDRPVGGIINQPFYESNGRTGRTMYGIPNVGYGGFSIVPPPAGKLIVTTTRSHSNQRVESALTALKPDEVLRVGGAGHKVFTFKSIYF